MSINRGAGAPDEDPQFDGGADFEAFDRGHRASLEAWYVTRWGLSRPDAADIAQEAFAGLAKRWPMLGTDEHRRRSYYTITRYKAVDFLRAQQRRVQPDVSLDAAGVELVADEATTNPEVMFAGEDRDTPLAAALRELPEKRRRALLGRVVVGMDFDELAEAERRSEAAVRKDVTRALVWLRRMLKAPAVVLLGFCARTRRAVRSSLGVVATVASQATILGLVFTAPLVVLEERDVLTDALETAPRHVALALPFMPERVARPPAPLLRLVISDPVTDRGPLRRVLRRITGSVPGVIPPKVLCVRERTCNGETVTVTVPILGVSHSQSQSYIEACWAFPAAGEPHLTCRNHEGAP